MVGINKSPAFDWDGFNKKEFAVLCEVNKEQFFISIHAPV